MMMMMMMMMIIIIIIIIIIYGVPVLLGHTECLVLLCPVSRGDDTCMQNLTQFCYC